MINLYEYIKKNKDILDDKLRTTSLLSDYFNGDKVKVKRMMKGYNIGIVKLFKEKDGFFDLEQKIIQTLMEGEDLQEQVADEIYHFWYSVFNGNEKYCYLGDFYVEKIEYEKGKGNAKAYHCLMDYIDVDAWSKIEEISFYSDVNIDSITNGILIANEDSYYKISITNNCLNIYTSALRFAIPQNGIITKIENDSFVMGNFISHDLVITGFFGLFNNLEKINGIKNAYVVDCSNLFAGCSNLEKLDLSGFDTSKVTNMVGMFARCSNLEKLDLSGFDTSKVVNMAGMFRWCCNLKNLDLSGFNTSQANRMNNMFERCICLNKLDVSSFDTSNVTNMGGMFAYCEVLKELDISGFDTSKVTNMTCMFVGCRSLEKLDVSGFDTSKVTNMSGMFQCCENLKEINVSRSFGKSMFTGIAKKCLRDVRALKK